MALFDKLKGKQAGSGCGMRAYLCEELKRHIAQWDKEDIYAVSLFVYDENDNPCAPTVTLGYNTESNLQEQADLAFNEAEARWNYAFWLQNEEYVFGVDETRPLVEQWIREKGFRCYTDEELFGEEEPDPATYEGITAAFVEELVEIVRELHQSGFVREQFGRPIPLLIHELEYYDQIADQNMAANPAETVEEFVRFCCMM